jgi:patatin-like phospholipase/acyl hydrolase
MSCKYRVVISIDGGGKKGLIPLRLLSFLEEQLNTYIPKSHLSSWVDVYAGTSTSAIIAGALAVSGVNGRTHYPSDMTELYLSRGKHFFDSPKSNHSVHPLNYVLEHFYGDLTLSQIRKHFLFVSYDLDRDEPFLFTDSQHHIQQISVSKMMQACCAAPGFLDAVLIGNKRLADGMLTTKNPSKLAFQYARVFYPDDPIVLISIGTGKSPEGSFEEKQAEDQHEHLVELAKNDSKLVYFRFNPELSDPNMEMEQLIEATDVYIDENKRSIERLLHMMEIKAGRLL